MISVCGEQLCLYKLSLLCAQEPFQQDVFACLWVWNASNLGKYSLHWVGMYFAQCLSYCRWVHSGITLLYVVEIIGLDEALHGIGFFLVGPPRLNSPNRKKLSL